MFAAKCINYFCPFNDDLDAWATNPAHIDTMRFELHVSCSYAVHVVAQVGEFFALLAYLHTVKVYQDFPDSLPRFTGLQTDMPISIS
jgi:hypothetical protein